VHGGIAAKKAADAIAPCINGKDATQCFALLAERLDEASRRDRDDVELQIASFAGDDAFEEIDSSRWLRPDDTDLSRRAASAFAHCALARATASKRREAADNRDARRRATDAMEGKRKTKDVRAVLGCSVQVEGQTNWSLASSFGDGLRNASVVAPREDSAIELKAHDDPREVEAQIRRAQAAHDAVIAKRLEVATALNAKQSRSQEVSDDEEEEEVKSSPQKQQQPVQDDDDEEHDDVVLELEDVARVTRKGLVRGRFVLTEQSFKWRGPGLCGNQIYGTFVDLHAIDATPARWRGDVGAPDTLVDFHTGGDSYDGRLNDVSAVLLRRYRLRDAGVEIYASSGESLFLDCTAERLVPRDITETFSDDDASENDEPGSPTPFGDRRSSLEPPSNDQAVKDGKRRDELVRKLISSVRTARARGGGSGDRGPTGLFPLLQAPKTHPRRLLRRATRCWQERQLSNFDYLLIVNALAGRSFEDPCQYPVMPWVICDFRSHTLYLDRPQTYRDLRKPMGAVLRRNRSPGASRHRRDISSMAWRSTTQLTGGFPHRRHQRR
jgi:hypothetical protein